MIGRAVVLAGDSSAGKTSVAQELQTRLGEPLLHVGVDHSSRCSPTTGRTIREVRGRDSGTTTPPTTTALRWPASAMETLGEAARRHAGRRQRAPRDGQRRHPRRNADRGLHHAYLAA
ncbi:phosphotransferase-like protein [Mobilicoccus caccae]|uniref:phosphotransferase-like protein n=1 Tax=Mobilicoccus caccae TaxID=1859295 RepID=UPI003D66CFDB